MEKFYSRSVSKKLLIVLLSFICAGRLWADTPVGGSVSGTWTKANSPYVLTTTAIVPSGQTLTIESGVTVKITTGSIQLLVQGTLHAVGASSDSILFIRTGDFHGSDQVNPILFDNTSANSILQYTVINNLGFYSSSDETYSILIQSTSCIITNCTFESIRGTAIGIDETVKPIISNNIFKLNSNLDVVTHPDELKNISGNNSLKMGIFQIAIPIASSDTIKAENIYYRMIRSINIPLSKTFNIEPGAALQINTGSYTLSVSGTLKAIGLPDKYISITKNGDYHGSDQSIPIVFETVSNKSILRYVNIQNLGYYSNSDMTSAIFIRSTSCTIDSCLIQGIRGSAIKIGINAKPIVSNTSISSTNVNVVLDPDKLKNIINDNNSNSGGTGCTIGLTDSVAMAQNDTLYSYHISYTLLNVLTVPKTKTLTIDQKAVVYIPTGNTQLLVQGTLLATGTIDNYAQVSRVGDYHGSDQVVPIVFDTSSQNSLLHYLSVNNFGYYSNTGSTPTILIKSSSCSFVNTIIQSSKGLGVKIQDASPSFTYSCFYSNINGAVLSTGGTATFKYCNFLGNTSAITNTNATAIITADSCYWGDALGPQQITTNPAGVGDAVSDRVIYLPFTEDAYDCSYDILPLTLLNFQTTLNNSIVNCNWQTASEANTSYFIVQRSTDEINFANLGKIYASGNSTTSKTYSYADKSPDNGINYYRLQMVDKDGRYIYSQILPVNISIKQPFAIYPNPVKNVLYVQVQRDKVEKISLQVIDMQGKIVIHQNQQLAAGVTTLSVNTTTLSKGSYFIVIEGKTTEKKLFMKE